MRQYELWWAQMPDPIGRRPVLLLSRSRAYEYLTRVIVVEITSTVRNIPAEVSLGSAEGLRHRSVANFDNVHVVAKQRLLSRIGTLKPRRVDEVRRALARVAGIRPLSRAMLWFEFRKLTDDDLGAIFEFLRSVPPVRHRVNNADPPTYCPRCARRHGLGELNPP